MNNNGFSNILYTAIIAFTGALCKEINDKAHNTNESFSIFLGELSLHGFSGWIVGLAANKYLGLNDLTSIAIFAGVGGLFGYDLVKVILKMGLRVIAASRNIDFDASDLDDKPNNKADKPKKPRKPRKTKTEES